MALAPSSTVLVWTVVVEQASVDCLWLRCFAGGSECSNVVVSMGQDFNNI